MNITQDSFLIKRSSKEYIEKTLSENPDWKILDIGCGESANKFATTICDILDLTNFYKDRKFVRLSDKKLPFKDQEFDFVITSHVLEHVEDYSFFLSELSRVSKQGYIEVPTRLEDNLVFENKKAHLWHLVFDDINSQILISEKIQYFEPIFSIGTIKKLNQYFRESLVLELYWKDTIEFEKVISSPNQLDKISILNLFKKYFSKRFREFIRVLKLKLK